jgi:hypothetical protein
VNAQLTRGDAGCQHAAPSRLQDLPGDRLEVEVVQPDGGRALVVGTLDAVPESATGRALRITPLPAE